jgi:hypothetical protein
MTTNDPEVIAELRELYSQYERALVTNDVEKLVKMFWADPLAMRFGATENLYGYKEISEFRKARPSANLARTVTRLDIVAFGKDFASITLEFERESQRGRQSQIWVRFPEGWRIVAAHVSLIPSL